MFWGFEANNQLLDFAVGLQIKHIKRDNIIQFTISPTPYPVTMQDIDYLNKSQQSLEKQIQEKKPDQNACMF